MHQQKTLAVVALSALVAAQSLTSLSSECQAAVAAIQNNQEANACIAYSGLLSILVNPSDQSLIGPVNNWLESFCAAPDCSSSTISDIVANVSTGCATDLSNAGVTQQDVGVALPYIQSNFATAKQIICLADNSKDEFCATEELTDLQTFLGKPLTIQNLQSEANVQTAESIPTNITCSPCTQAVLVKLKSTDLSNIVDLATPVAQECGSDFAAATSLPPNIIVGTGSNVPKGSQQDGGAPALYVGNLLTAVGAVALAAFLA